MTKWPREEERIQSDSKGSLLWVCHWALREEAAEMSAEVGCCGSADVYGEGRTNGPHATLCLTCDGTYWTCFTVVFLHFLCSENVRKRLMFLAHKNKRKTDSKPGVKQKKISEEWYTEPLAMHRALSIQHHPCHPSMLLTVSRYRQQAATAGPLQPAWAHATKRHRSKYRQTAK